MHQHRFGLGDIPFCVRRVSYHWRTYTGNSIASAEETFFRIFYSNKGPSYRVANICFQKIKNQNWALIGRSVSTSTMVILIFRKICFQPRSPGGLFFLFSGCLFYSKFMRCAPPSVPHIQSVLVPPSLPRHTREHKGKHAQ